MKGNYLGEFEELVMLTCAYLKDESYGINIVEEIKSKLDRSVRLSAVHMTLYRLEDKKLVESHMGGSTTQRGGRRKRIFRLTSAGMEMLKATQRGRISLWNQVPELKLN
ncbi:PadR family transcriptional regulator [Roseivirga sp. E12]|uniref:PadR family transcriptional regulator n=1 Tax=Roseivirga sp. E12 TaxID=2819237 RepID=UPI001ABC4CEB|nr:helix-turn-helix transcriptional regulator [Roseivirga sp. E12]MBO3698060.1 helix-turn-helix transcriptional regulator [Roseivirga sp. E12]